MTSRPSEVALAALSSLWPIPRWLWLHVAPCGFLLHTAYPARVVQGRGKFCDRDISLWEISYFKCVRNFPLNSQAAVQNKPGAKFSHL